MSFCFRPTLFCARKARVTIPRLSPTHTRAKILRFFCPTTTTAHNNNIINNKTHSSCYLECTDPLFLLECSPDLVTEGFRDQTEDGTDVNPLMIVETHEEGDFLLDDSIHLDQWYPVGHDIGTIDDGDGDEDIPAEEWLWQAYSHNEGEPKRELNLPPHIATGKTGRNSET